jgi:hypothetical protein
MAEYAPTRQPRTRSIDCLFWYDCRVSRDAQRAWSLMERLSCGWATPVIRGPRHEPDHGPRCYKPDHKRRAGPTTAPLCCWGPSGQRAADADTTCGRASRPRAQEPAAGVMSRLHDRGPDSADRSPHTAGPNNPGRDIRLDLLGPAADGSGPGRREEWRGPIWDGASCSLRIRRADLGRAGPGRARCTVMGKRLFVAVTMLPLGYRTASRGTLCKGSAAGVQDSARMKVPARLR